MSKVDVLKKIDAIREESDFILKLIENGHVPQAKVHEAQELFRALKEKLRDERKRMATGRGKAALSEVEARFYEPAIVDAWVSTGISGLRWNSRPDRHRHGALFSVIDYMGQWTSHLKRDAI